MKLKRKLTTLLIPLLLSCFLIHAQDCEINNVIAEAHQCDDNGNFLVDIEFFSDNTSDLFQIVGNGTNYGTFAYGQPFYTIGPIVGDGTAYEFIVIDQADPNCSAFTELDSEDCSAGALCQITDLEAIPLECNPDGSYGLFVNFNFDNAPSNFFEITSWNGSIGTYSINSLPLTIPAFVGTGQPFDFITVCFNDAPNCCSGLDFEALTCPIEVCQINDVIVEAHECDDNGNFLVDVEFNSINTGDQFTIIVNGSSYGTFNYGDPFYTFGPLPGDGTTTWEILIIDINNPDCTGTVNLAPINCNECSITNLVAEPLECNPDGSYGLFLDFNFENAPNTFFDLSLNGQIVGFYQLSSLPLTLPSVYGSGNGGDVITVCINDAPDCCAIFEYEAPICPVQDCEIFEVFAEAYECDDNGNFLVDVAFGYVNTSPYFSILVNGVSYGPFNYGDPFYTIGPLAGDGTLYEILVQDDENPNCNGVTTIGPINCSVGDCNIVGLNVSALDCNPDGTYDLFVFFEVLNSPNDFFDVFINGNLFGTYLLEDLPLTVPSITGGGGAFDVIQVCINDAPNCCAIFEYTPPNCNDLCNISDVFAEAHDCDDDGNFLVDVAFNSNNTSDLFNIIVNGINYGTFQYGEPFYTIGPLAGDGTIHAIVVQDVADPNCNGVTTIGPINCSVGDCNIVGLNVSALDCNPDGTYDLFVFFEVLNSPNDFFDVFINGNLFGTYLLEDLPLTVPSITGGGGAFDVIQVCINDAPNCCAFFEYTAPNCNDLCNISDVFAEAYECDDDGNFLVDVAFGYNNTSDLFNIIVNDVNYGTFQYGEPFYTFGPLAGDGTIYDIVIQDAGDPNCMGVTVIGPINCSVGNCSISELTAVPSDCNEDDTYDLVVNFEYNNPGNDFFDAFINGNYIGTYLLANLPITIPSIEGSNTGFDVIDVCINDMPNCCSALDYFAPICTGDPCEITNVFAEAHECDDDGNFLVDVEFNSNNTSDLFYILANGVNYGTFNYGQTFYTFGPLAGDGTVYQITIQDVSNNDCNGETVIGPVNCTAGSCSISELTAGASVCNDNGTYNLFVNFEYTNPGNDFFDVFINGNFIGFYLLENLPITIPSVQGSNLGIDVLEVCINDMPDCCNVIDYEAPVCNNGLCNISDVFAEAYECDDDGNFLVDVSFGYVNNSDLFLIIVNDVDYGTFQYGEPFYTFGPLAGNGTVYDIVIQDVADPNCMGVTTIGPINCDATGCAISDLEVNELDCNEDGTYNMVINFNYVNPGNDFFDLYDVNGNILGTYLLENLPVTYNNFTPSGNDFDIITVCINDVQDCCSTLQFEAPNCNNGGDCEISGIDVFPISCNGDGSYSLLIDLAHQNTSGSFNVIQGGNVIGTYSYQSLPIIVPSFESNGGLIQHIAVCDNDYPDCCIDTEFEGLICDNCEYWDIEVTPQECLPDGTFPVTLNFNHFGGGPNFTILGNGQNYGIFNYADLPITFGNFDGNGLAIVYNLIIVDLTNPFCNFSWEFEAIECGGNGQDAAVWPGDTNDDNISNHIDLLNIGLTNGFEGPARADISIAWEAMPAFDWDGTFADEVNHKYADCNGDGLVSTQDLLALESNYGFTHGTVEPFDGIIGTPNDPPLFVDLPENSLESGVPFIVPIILGADDLPVDQIYGLAFTINFDPEVLDVDQVFVEVGASWLGTPGENLISINRTLADQGIVEVAMSRTDHENVGGNGPIAQFIGIIDDVLGKSEVQVSITNIKAITSDEAPVVLHNPIAMISLSESNNTEEVIDGLIVFPNPTNQFIKIRNESIESLGAIRVYNVLGQNIKNISKANNFESIDVSTWTPGIYFVHIEVGIRTKIAKIMVTRDH